MKTKFLLSFVFLSLIGKGQNLVYLTIADDLNIPQDSIECTVNFANDSIVKYYSDEGLVTIDIAPFDPKLLSILPLLFTLATKVLIRVVKSTSP